MCLTLHTRQNFEPTQTTKHYLVWKWFCHLDDKYVSFYRRYTYKPGRLYVRKLKFINYRFAMGGSVDNGIHALRRKVDKWKGRHFPSHGAVCLPCIIPAGSAVYYGDSNDVVTTKLIVFENIDQLNKWCKNNPINNS